MEIQVCSGLVHTSWKGVNPLYFFCAFSSFMHAAECLALVICSINFFLSLESFVLFGCLCVDIFMISLIFYRHITVDLGWEWRRKWLSKEMALTQAAEEGTICDMLQFLEEFILDVQITRWGLFEWPRILLFQQSKISDKGDHLGTSVTRTAFKGNTFRKSKFRYLVHTYFSQDSGPSPHLILTKA